MRLLVFGASGATGRHLVRLALSQGHGVTAFVRDPARLPAMDERLDRVVGDVMQPASVEAAFDHHDAVLCALGTMPEAGADRSRRQPAVPVCSVAANPRARCVPSVRATSPMRWRSTHAAGSSWRVRSAWAKVGKRAGSAPRGSCARCLAR